MKSARLFYLVLLAAWLNGTCLAAPYALPVPPMQTPPPGTYPILLKNRTRTFILPSPRQIQPIHGMGAGTMAMIAVPGVFGAVEAAHAIGSAGLGGYVAPLYLAGSLIGTASLMKSMSTLQQSTLPAYLPQSTPSPATITLTLWDDALADATVLYMANRDSATDASQVAGYRDALLARYPVANEVVMEIQIANGTQAPMCFSPFSRHIHLLDSRGARVQPLGYDSALDHSLQPGETVTGKIYFPRINPADGAQVTVNGVRGALDDLAGKTFEFNFQ